MKKLTNDEVREIAVTLRDHLSYDETCKMIADICAEVERTEGEMGGSPLDKMTYIAREMYGRGALMAVGLINEAVLGEDLSE